MDVTLGEMGEGKNDGGIEMVWFVPGFLVWEVRKIRLSSWGFKWVRPENQHQAKAKE